MIKTVVGLPGRKWDDLTWEQVYNNIEYLMWRDPAQSEKQSSTKANHDPEMARNIIELFYERMRDDQPFDDHVLYHFMKHVFTDMVENKLSADQALGLTRAKSQSNRKNTEQRDMQITAEVTLLLMIAKESPQKNLKTTGDIYHIISTLHGASKAVIERARNSFSSFIELLPASTLKSFVSKELSSCADFAYLAKPSEYEIKDLLEKQKDLAISVATTHEIPLHHFKWAFGHLSELYSCSEAALKILVSDEVLTSQQTSLS